MSNPARRCGALAGDAAEHRIDQPGIVQAAPVGLRQPHREIDRGVVGHLEPENLRGADQQRGLDPRRVGGKTALEQQAEQMAQRAEPPQHRRHHGAHQRAVAIGERRQRRMRLVVELLVERPPSAQHRLDDVGGDSAGG